jgi:2-C-methyl-D-erythritol 4-phosphate cytidylyltransferase
VSTALIVPAAGSGRRLGLGRPKAVVELAGVPIVRLTLSRFADVVDIVETVVVAPPGFVREVQHALLGLEWPRCEVRVVAGGATRQESVRCGLESVQSAPEIVCVHDAARPFVARSTVEAVLRAALTHGAATAASRPRDSVRQDVDGATRALDRSKIWLVETPQAFSFSLIRDAHERARATGLRSTDDAVIAESCGNATVLVVESDGVNLKITHPEDLQIASRLLEYRVRH